MAKIGQYERQMAKQLSAAFVGKEHAVEELRVSVRELVEFTLHGADIRLISGRMQDMLDGTLGHQARQKLLGDGWQAEVPLNLDFGRGRGIDARPRRADGRLP